MKKIILTVNLPLLIGFVANSIDRILLKRRQSVFPLFVGKKKELQEVSEEELPWYPRIKLKVNIHIFGLTKCTKNVSVFVLVFLYAVTMLIFQIKRIISSENWFN